MWTLILLMMSNPYTTSQANIGNAITVESISGFSSQTDCEAAGIKALTDLTSISDGSTNIGFRMKISCIYHSRKKQ